MQSEAQTVTPNVNIPNNDTNGVSTTVTMANNIKTEQVTITVNISHDNRGDLKVLLTSPLGTSSTLVDVNNSDTGDNYNNWVFSTVRNWG